MMTIVWMLLAGQSAAQDVDDSPADAPTVWGASDRATEGEDADGADPADDGADGPPEGVEAGSVQKVYRVKEGDTLASIAASQGFMPADLTAWNELDGEPAAGTDLVLWAAPLVLATESQAQPEPEVVDTPPQPPKEKKDKGTVNAERDGLAFFAGVQVGPAFSLNPLGTAISPRIELGVELPPMDRSWRIFGSVQYLKPLGNGEIADARMPGTSTYALKQDELSIAFGPQFRLGMLDGKVVPELSVGPNIYMYRSTVNGESGGADFGESSEQFTRVGVYAAGGVGIGLGPGELTALLTLGSSGLGGTVTGEAASAALSPTVGYRVLF
jgi:hypothetical protein